MALSLITEVIAYLPGSDLTTAERLVLLAIAEQANKDTREAYQSTDKRRWVLSEVVGLSATGLRDVLQRLAKRGLEARVAFGKDSKGRVLYAVYGRQTTYRLPRLGDGLPSPRGDSSPSGRGDGQALTGDGQAPTGDGQLSPFPSASHMHPKSMHAREPWQIVVENTGAKPNEAKAVANRIVSERNPRNPAGFIVSLARSGDLDRYLTEHRAAQIKADREAADVADRKARQGLPMCDHGTVGGELPHSVTGEIRCKKCRDIRGLNETRRSA